MMSERWQLRRQLLATVLGLGLAATIGVTAGFAQDDGATPEAPASTDEQPAAPAMDAESVAAVITGASDAISAVQADRDAVDGQTDLTTVDQLLAQATSLRDQARSAADGGDTATALGYASAAVATAQAAERLLHAQLTDYGLPSQQAGTSRLLVDVYYQVQELTNQATADASVDVSFYVTTAQALYTAAHDQYTNGLYAQSAQTALVASQVARIGDMMYAVSQGGTGFGLWSVGGDVEMNGPRVEVREFDGPGMRGAPGDVRGDTVVVGPRGEFDLLPDDSGQDLPVTVPEPVF
jgi:hypothetical protein